MQDAKITKSLNIHEFKNNVDSWIKQINSDFSKFRHIPKVIDESIDNIQHNYELVRELQQEIEDLRQEIKLMKEVQFALLRKTVK